MQLVWAWHGLLGWANEVVAAPQGIHAAVQIVQAGQLLFCSLEGVASWQPAFVLFSARVLPYSQLYLGRD